MRKMKDSGIDLLGQIPISWNRVRLRFLCDITTGNQDTQDANPDGEYPFYVRSPIVEYSDRYTFNGESILMAGDGAGAGKVFHYIDGGKHAVHQRVYRLYDFRGIKGKYLHYFMETLFSFEIDKGSAQTTVPSVRLPMIQNFNICFPSIIEQERIIEFLDSMCKKIDELITDVQSQINILEQYKQSVITEVVTKGLNTNVEMKDSGVEWIGEISLNWETRKIGRLFTLRNEKNYKSLDEVQLLSLYTDIGVFPHGEQAERGNKAVQAEGYKIVKKNDIVVNIILAWMGAIGVSEYDGVTSPAYDVYMPDTSKVVPHYYHYVFRTKAIAGECYKYGRGIMLMRWRTYSSEFNQIPVPFPPIDEQQAIADYLDDKCAKIDKIIEEKKKQIVTLEEYKKALVFEYVTGKKEIKD